MGQKNKKLSTKIHGLDNLFHGGLHLEEKENKKENKAPNLVTIIRGDHGTNKIHLAMQMCEGLNDSIEELSGSIEELSDSIEELSDSSQGSPAQKKEKMLFVSLNKDDEKVKKFYYDFYVKRLIRNIQIKAKGWENNEKIIEQIFVGEEPFSSIVNRLLSQNDQGDNHLAQKAQKVFALGVLYYNPRTHGLHIRQQTKNDDSDNTKLLSINYENLQKIEFWGREKLVEGNEMADNRTIFFNLMQKLEELDTKTHYNCIMIDGISMLTPDESEDCPINALIALMRHNCTIGILTTNNNQSISKLDSDIVIDLRIRLDEMTNHTKKELSIYKCLYQKNTYGWHQYKMRNAGVEVIPSIHKTLSRRNYMDQSVAEAMLPLDKMPYSYWLNENKNSFENQDKDFLIKTFEKFYQKFNNNNKTGYNEINQSNLYAITSCGNPKDAINFAMSKINSNDDHFLFIDFKRNRKDFWESIGKDLLKEKEKDSIKIKSFKQLHYFGFRAGCIYADEFLYIIEQQVSAIAREIMQEKKEKDVPIFHYYKYIHIVMGDLNLIQYCYPCLYSEQLFIPAFSALTKGNYMTNFIYMTKDNSDGSNRIKKQLLAVADEVI